MINTVVGLALVLAMVLWALVAWWPVQREARRLTADVDRGRFFQVWSPVLARAYVSFSLAGVVGFAIALLSNWVSWIAAVVAFVACALGVLIPWTAASRRYAERLADYVLEEHDPAALDP